MRLQAFLIALSVALIGLIGPSVEASYIPSLIRTIQTGTVTVNTPASTGTATITSVNAGSAVVFPGGVQGGDTTIGFDDGGRATNVLTNATTVTVDCGADFGDTPNCMSAFTVVEFISSVKVQRGIITLGVGSAFNSATITAVNLNKSWLVSCGQTAGQAFSDHGSLRGQLSNATTVTVVRNNAGLNIVNYCYQVVSFK